MEWNQNNLLFNSGIPLVEWSKQEIVSYLSIWIDSKLIVWDFSLYASILTMC